MKFLTKHPVRVLITLALLFLLTTSVSAISEAGYSLPWWTIDSGGGASSAGNYHLTGTLGQPDAVKSSGGNYRLEGGFWVGISVVASHFLYLPLTVK